MVEIASRRATVVTLTLLATLAPVAGARADVRTPLIVRVYDGTASEAFTREEAIRTAAAIVADAGIAAEWRDCSGGSPAGGCDGYRQPGDLIVRMVRTATHIAGARATIDEAGLRAALGFSVVEPGRGMGALATIFLERVHAVAKRTGVDRASLLGRAIAHEIGHLLLATSGHGRSGLMREVWTDAELVSNRPEDWRFAEADRRRLQAGVRGDALVLAAASGEPASPSSAPEHEPRSDDAFGR